MLLAHSRLDWFNQLTNPANEAPPIMSTVSQNPARLAKSAIVGIVATVVDLVVLGVLVEVLRVPSALANVPALTLGLLVQFVGNKLYAFDNKATDARALARQGSLFLLIEAGAFILNAGLFHLLGPIVGLPWWLARMSASAAVYFGFSYRLWALVFKAA